MKIIILLITLIIIPMSVMAQCPPVVGGYPMVITNVELIGNESEPLAVGIKIQCLGYNKSEKIWVAEHMDGNNNSYIQKYPTSRWFVYTMDHTAIAVWSDDKIKLINTGALAPWQKDPFSKACPYGDALLVRNDEVEALGKIIGEDVDCVVWEPKTKRWEVTTQEGIRKVKRFLDPKEYTIYTMDGTLSVKNNKAVVSPTYMEK